MIAHAHIQQRMGFRLMLRMDPTSFCIGTP